MSERRVSEPVRVERRDGVAIVAVDNPPVNALANATLDALAAAAAELGTDPEVRAIVLTGTGEKAFAAGADLDEFSAALGDRDWIEDHTSRSRRAFDRWDVLGQPVIAAVQASAIGGGLELALVCDLIVADPSARFGVPEVRLGLMPGAGGTQRLPRRIGAGRALELALLGSTVDAARARELGLVNRVAAPGGALAEAAALADKLAALSAVAVRAIKASVRIAGETSLSAGLDSEREAFIGVFASADASEGVHAFIEKRPPEFRHS